MSSCARHARMLTRGVVLALAALFFLPAAVQAESDVVLLVDVSTSMRTLFPEVRERVYQEIDKAEVGDRIVLITFGEAAHLLARRRLRGPADRAYLRAVVQGLEPNQRATYLTVGLDRGFDELLHFFEAAPERDRRLLWLSDDKNNPPASLGDDVFTLQDLREQNAEFQPEGEWFSFDSPLGDGVASELSEFLQWARRTLFLVYVRETGVALGTHQGTELQETRTIQFSPQHSGLVGLEFLVLARVSDPTTPGAEHHEVEVEPSVITVKAEDWSEDFTLTFSGPPGAYSGYIVFESYARTNFRVEPERIPLSFTLEAPALVAEAPAEAPKTDLETLESIAQEILESAERPVGGTRASRPLQFGPVEPGKNYRNVIPVSTNAAIKARDIRLEKVIDLPAGFDLTAEFTGDGQLFEARLNLDVSTGAEMSQRLMQGGVIEGRISFATDDERIKFTPIYRPILINLDQRSVRWGRRLLPDQPDIGRTAASEMSLEEIGQLGAESAVAKSKTSGFQGVVTQARRVGPFVLGGLVLLGIVALLVTRLRPRKTAFYGELVVIKDPTPRKMRNVSLARLSAGRGGDGLTVGSDARSDIVLKHESVRELHARLISVPVGEDSVISLQAARGAEVKVNDQVRTERVHLHDKDLIGLGDYIFLFSSPEPQKRVVVRFLDGSVLRGTPLAWDINEASFQLLLDDPGDEDEVAHVDFSDLKAVFFVQDEGEGPRRDRIPAARLRGDFELEVEFQDGEKLEGYVMDDYTDYANRFYIVPKEDPTVISVLVERANLKGVVQRERTDAPGAGGNWLQRLLNRS